MATHPKRRPKPKGRKKLNATVTISTGTDGRGKWEVRCSKHGLVSRHKFWHNAATAKLNHQAQHRE